MVGIIVELHINFFAYNKTFFSCIRVYLLTAPRIRASVSKYIYKYTRNWMFYLVWLWILMELVFAHVGFLLC